MTSYRYTETYTDDDSNTLLLAINTTGLPGFLYINTSPPDQIVDVFFSAPLTALQKTQLDALVAAS